MAETPWAGWKFASGLPFSFEKEASDPEASGQQTSTTELANGYSRAQVVTAILRSQESSQDIVQSLYNKYLGRAADANFLISDAMALEHNARLESLIFVFLCARLGSRQITNSHG